MLEILAIILFGVLAGVFTGLTPGIHPNTVVFSSMPLYLSSSVEFGYYAAFISGMSISHTFHDFIPAIFLGVPEPSSALAALPGQKMALEGRGLEAFHNTVFGGMYSMLATLIFAPLVFFALERIYGFFEPFMAYLLFFILLVIVFKSESFFEAATVAILSGLLGVLSFKAPVNQQYVLVPVFGGLFALPSIINSFRSENVVPDQLRCDLRPEDSRFSGVLGFFAAVPMTIFPGLSSSIATTFLLPLVRTRERFLSAVGGVNTSDIFLSFLALMAMGKARSGASVALQVTGNSETALFVLGCSILAAAVSIPLALVSARTFLESGLLEHQAGISAGIIILLLAVSFYLTGFLGLLVFFTASSTGFFAALNSERHSCMAVLLVPAILFFSGTFI